MINLFCLKRSFLGPLAIKVYFNIVSFRDRANFYFYLILCFSILSSTLQTYEFDEEVSNEDDKLFEDSHHYSQSYYHSSTIGWRAVPRAQSRSISSPRRRKRSLVDYEQTTLDGGQNGFFKGFLVNNLS